MTTLREAAQMALDALEQVQEADTAGATPKMVMEARKLYEPTITALRAALAQPKPEQLGRYLITHGKPDESLNPLPLYTAPPQREWVGLTDEELEFYTEELGQGELGRGVLRAVVDFLKGKNT